MTDLASSHEHVFVPAAPAAPPLAVLALHGTGGDEHDLVPLAQRIAPGAAVLSPRGRVLEGTMPRFFRRLREGVFDQEDLRRRTDDLAVFVGAARSRYAIDDRPLVAIGYSNGANIATALLLRHPALLVGAILLRPMVPFEPAPEALPDLRRVSVLCLGGVADATMPSGEFERLHALLSRCGASVTAERTGRGHGLEQSDLVAAERWLASGVVATRV